MNQETIAFGEEVTADYMKARDREWLVTNGLGGYASSTIVGANTRGYHGLLVACLPPGMRRLLLLSKLEEEILIDGEQFPLSINRYPGTYYPDGNKYLKQFILDPYPRFLYKVRGASVEKTVSMPPMLNNSLISYRVSAPTPIKLLIRPLVNSRGIHTRTKMGSGLTFKQHFIDGGVQISSGLHNPSLYLRSNLGSYESSETWYKNMVYDVETERCLEDCEDHFSPGFFSATLEDGDVLSLEASLDASTMPGVEPIPKRVQLSGQTSTLRSRLLYWLTQASDQFVVKLPDGGRTVVAGYHWFGEWGRDAFIALPGLLLTRGRFDEAKEIIRRFLSNTRNGLSPTYFDEDGKPEFASIDTSLWLIYSIDKYLSYTADLSFAAEVYPKLKEVIESYRRGTEYGVGVSDEGLVEADSEGSSLTWMDARVDGEPVTPRAGKCVEVNALWYNALRSMGKLTNCLGEDSSYYEGLSREVWRSFNDIFWSRESGCLYDCVKEGVGDRSIRPNQILSISLPFPVLDRERWGRVFKVVERHLLTPYGLRTLSPQDESYCGMCVGGQRERDVAYHNGTVWAWLIGPFLTAYTRLGWSTHGFLIRHILDAFSLHLCEAGLGSISEIFDGDTPHRPGGCISQAWSVGELLRVISEDLTGNVGETML